MNITPVIPFLITATFLVGLTAGGMFKHSELQESPIALRIIVSFSVDDVFCTAPDGKKKKAFLVNLREYYSTPLYAICIEAEDPPDAQYHPNDGTVFLEETETQWHDRAAGQRAIETVLKAIRLDHDKLILATTRPNLFTKSIIPGWRDPRGRTPGDSNPNIQRLLSIFEQKGRAADEAVIPHVHRLVDDTAALIKKAEQFPQTKNEWKYELHTLYQTYMKAVHKRRHSQNPDAFLYKFALMKRFSVVAPDLISNDGLPSTQELENTTVKCDRKVVWVFAKKRWENLVGESKNTVFVVMKEYAGDEYSVHCIGPEDSATEAVDAMTSFLNKIRNGSKVLLMSPHGNRSKSQTSLIGLVNQSGRTNNIFKAVDAYLHDPIDAVRMKVKEAGIRMLFEDTDVGNVLQDEKDAEQKWRRFDETETEKDRSIREMKSAIDVEDVFFNKMAVTCNDLAKTRKYELARIGKDGLKFEVEAGRESSWKSVWKTVTAPLGALKW